MYIGVIQTAYANGSSTKYLTDVLVSLACFNMYIFIVVEKIATH